MKRFVKNFKLNFDQIQQNETLVFYFPNRMGGVTAWRVCYFSEDTDEYIFSIFRLKESDDNVYSMISVTCTISMYICRIGSTNVARERHVN